jgi:HlyD family secretion protein
MLENQDFEAQLSAAKAQIETLRRQQETAKAKLGQVEAEKTRVANGARSEERREARTAYEQTLPILENAKTELARSERLFESGDISRQQLDRDRRDFEVAQKQSQTARERFNIVNAPARIDDLAKADADIQTAAAQIREFDALVKEASARIREAEARLEKTFVRAPIDGIVLRKRLKAGESVTPENPNGSILTVADASALRVRADIDETDVGRIRENQKVYAVANAYPERKFYGRVVKIGQILGRKNFRTERPTEKVDTKILEVLVELNPNQKLPLGLRVDVFIENE